MSVTAGTPSRSSGKAETEAFWAGLVVSVKLVWMVIVVTPERPVCEPPAVAEAEAANLKIPSLNGRFAPPARVILAVPPDACIGDPNATGLPT